MAADLVRRGLPLHWSFGVMKDGRIFFINDETQKTTWLHPLTGEPLSKVYQGSDLPNGWERGVTPEGIPYYADHNRQTTTFIHPITKETVIQSESIQSPDTNRLHDSKVSKDQPYTDTKRMSMRKKNFHRAPIVQRIGDAPVTMKGWLYKQDSKGLKAWKKRWFVLSDFCLFYYKGPDENQTLGSILLPSYKISPVTIDDKIVRKFAFKAEHKNMRTYFFSTDIREELMKWIKMMSLAAMLQNDPSIEDSYNMNRQTIKRHEDDDDEAGFRSARFRHFSLTDQVAGPTEQQPPRQKQNIPNMKDGLGYPRNNGYISQDHPRYIQRPNSSLKDEPSFRNSTYQNYSPRQEGVRTPSQGYGESLQQPVDNRTYQIDNPYQNNRSSGLTNIPDNQTDQPKDSRAIWYRISQQNNFNQDKNDSPLRNSSDPTYAQNVNNNPQNVNNVDIRNARPINSNKPSALPGYNQKSHSKMLDEAGNKTDAQIPRQIKTHVRPQSMPPLGRDRKPRSQFTHPQTTETHQSSISRPMEKSVQHPVSLRPQSREAYPQTNSQNYEHKQSLDLPLTETKNVSNLYFNQKYITPDHFKDQHRSPLSPSQLPLSPTNQTPGWQTSPQPVQIKNRQIPSYQDLWQSNLQKNDQPLILSPPKDRSNIIQPLSHIVQPSTENDQYQSQFNKDWKQPQSIKDRQQAQISKDWQQQSAVKDWQYLPPSNKDWQQQQSNKDWQQQQSNKDWQQQQSNKDWQQQQSNKDWQQPQTSKEWQSLSDEKDKTITNKRDWQKSHYYTNTPSEPVYSQFQTWPKPPYTGPTSERPPPNIAQYIPPPPPLSPTPVTDWSHSKENIQHPRIPHIEITPSEPQFQPQPNSFLETAPVPPMRKTPNQLEPGKREISVHLKPEQIPFKDHLHNNENIQAQHLNQPKISERQSLPEPLYQNLSAFDKYSDTVSQSSVYSGDVKPELLEEKHQRSKLRDTSRQQLQEWKERMKPQPVNLPIKKVSVKKELQEYPPARPPLPDAYRTKLIQDLAEQGSVTAQNILKGRQLESKTGTQSNYFQFPELTGQRHPGDGRQNSEYPEVYLRAKKNADEAELKLLEERYSHIQQTEEKIPLFPDSYLKAKESLENQDTVKISQNYTRQDDIYSSEDDGLNGAVSTLTHVLEELRTVASQIKDKHVKESIKPDALNHIGIMTKYSSPIVESTTDTESEHSEQSARSLTTLDYTGNCLQTDNRDLSCRQFKGGLDYVDIFPGKYLESSFQFFPGAGLSPKILEGQFQVESDRKWIDIPDTASSSASDAGAEGEDTLQNIIPAPDDSLSLEESTDQEIQMPQSSELQKGMPTTFISQKEIRISGLPSGRISACKEDLTTSDQETTTEDEVDKSSMLPSQTELNTANLMGKSYEELVLLLIQLRRNQAKISEARNLYLKKINLDKQVDTGSRKRHSTGLERELIEQQLKEIEELRHQNEQLEKELELGRPLISLVDNMVKLSAFYGTNIGTSPPQFEYKPKAHMYKSSKKLIEFSRKLQEQRLIYDQQEGLKYLSTDERDLEEKLERLYELDKVLQEDSIIMTNLKEDKEMIESAIKSVKQKIDAFKDNPAELEKSLKQHRKLEKELIFVRTELIKRSKRLEETSSKQAKVEHDILLLRNKIERDLLRNADPHPKSSDAIRAKQLLERELRGLQEVMKDLAKQREQLHEAMESLKQSHNMNILSPGYSTSKNRDTGTYLQTDLDTMETKDISDTWQSSPNEQTSIPRISWADWISQKNSIYDPESPDFELLPPRPPPQGAYADTSSTDDNESILEVNDTNNVQDISEADEKMKRFYGLLPKERQIEVKTVREVKRESAEKRRTRERERKKLPSDDFDMDDVIDPTIVRGRTQEKVGAASRSKSLPRSYGGTAIESSLYETFASLELPGTQPNIVKKVAFAPYRKSISPTTKPLLTARERLFGKDILVPPPRPPKTVPEKSNPTYLGFDPKEASQYRKPAGSRRKQRHYTISSSQPLILELRSPAKKLPQRARDDHDILELERTLGRMRESFNITPDLVKSTIRKVEANQTIDKEISLPQKVLIPERYVEEFEELSQEEKDRRKKKAEMIKKLLAKPNMQDWGHTQVPKESSLLLRKFEEEKRQREHLLTLNQILAKEVTEKSREVAAKNRALAEQMQADLTDSEDEDLNLPLKTSKILDRDAFYS